MFGAVKGAVGVVDKGLGVGGAGGDGGGDAAADGGPASFGGGDDFVAGEGGGAGDLNEGADAFGDEEGGFGVGAWEEDDELFAADAGDEVVFDTEALLEEGGDALEDAVAVGVAEVVVDGFEVVDVDHDGGKRCGQVGGAVPKGDETFLVGMAVGEAGEPVGGGKADEVGVGDGEQVVLDAAAQTKQPGIAVFAGDDVVREEGEESYPEDASADGELLRGRELQVEQEESELGKVTQGRREAGVEQVDAKDGVDGEEDEEDLALGLDGGPKAGSVMEKQHTAADHEAEQAGGSFAGGGALFTLHAPGDEQSDGCDDAQADRHGAKEAVWGDEVVADQEEVVDDEGDETEDGELADAPLALFFLKEGFHVAAEARDGKAPEVEAIDFRFDLKEVVWELGGSVVVWHAPLRLACRTCLATPPST